MRFGPGDERPWAQDSRIGRFVGTFTKRDTFGPEAGM